MPDFYPMTNTSADSPQEGPEETPEETRERLCEALARGDRPRVLDEELEDE